MSQNFSKKTIVGLFAFFVGVAAMAGAIYELRENNPAAPAEWTIPVLFIGAFFTVGGVLYSAAQHFKRLI